MPAMGMPAVTVGRAMLFLASICCIYMATVLFSSSSDDSLPAEIIKQPTSNSVTSPNSSDDSHQEDIIEQAVYNATISSNSINISTSETTAKQLIPTPTTSSIFSDASPLDDIIKQSISTAAIPSSAINFPLPEDIIKQTISTPTVSPSSSDASLTEEIFVEPDFEESRHSFRWDNIKHVIAFGDSHTFIQGTKGYPGFSFIGDYENHFDFAPEELLASRFVERFWGTKAGGQPIWVQFLTGCGVKKGDTNPSNCKMPLWNFACAGSGMAEKFAEIHHPWTIPLVNQTQRFLNWGAPVLETKMNKSEALVVLWPGANDIWDTYRRGIPRDDYFGEYHKIIRFMFETSIQPLYDAGYENFLFLNQAPLHRSPHYWNQLSIPLFNATTMGWWNSILSEHNAGFAETHKSASFLVYDTFSFLTDILDNPGQYQIANTTKYCREAKNETVFTNPGVFGCAPIDTYFWFDFGHLTSYIQKLMATDMKAFLKYKSDV